MDITNLAKKFSDARRNLMPPHSIARALSDSRLALHGVTLEDLDETPRQWVVELQNFLDTSDYDQHTPTGIFVEKAKAMSYDDMLELSRLIDELARWFYRAAVTKQAAD